MKKRLIIISLAILGFANPIHAGKFKGLSVGANAGYSNFDAWNGDVFCQANFQFGRLRFEPKAGIGNHPFQIDFEELNGLNVESAGLFLEGAIYPFRQYLFTGLRLEYDYNWFTGSAQQRLDEKYIKAPMGFMGFTFSGMAGLDIPLFKAVSLRLSVSPGVRIYTLNEWEASGNGVQINLSSRGEPEVQFVNQWNVGIVIRLFDKK
ncbi:MAG: hypothetical protein LBT27_03175 [Prevotellaceae bacterium]|jgi:hypothetical protein|nr:hypothetical protein [Prevotellaceae bacterium]